MEKEELIKKIKKQISDWDSYQTYNRCTPGEKIQNKIAVAHLYIALSNLVK